MDWEVEEEEARWRYSDAGGRHSCQYYENQQRNSGDPYLMHPVAVANILSDLKLDSATIATGLLHDTIEDTKATYKTVKDEFGKEVADLVEGVTKISELEDKAKQRLQNCKFNLYKKPK